MDNDFKKIEKRVGTGFKLFGAFWLFSFLASLALTGGVIYVICHFLARYW
jgi:hypothetical protein